MERYDVKKTALAVVLAGAMLLGGCADGKAPVPSTTAPITQPTQSDAGEQITEPMVTEPSVTAPEAGSISYEQYLALDEDTQAAYSDGFETTDAFFAWLSEAQKAYYATMPTSDGSGEGLEDWDE